MYDLVAEMNWVRDFCSKVHSVRKTIGIPASQPLRSLTLYKGEELFGLLLSQYKDIISDECNVRSVSWEIAFDDDYRFYNISSEYKLNFKESGRIFGKDTQQIGKLVKAGDVIFHPTYAQVGSFDVPLDLIETKRMVDNTGNVKSLGEYVNLVDDESFFVLDIQIYRDLFLQKLAQDIVKLINSKRREVGYDVGFLAFPHLHLGSDYFEALKTHEEFIKKNAKLLDYKASRNKTNDEALELLEFVA